MNDREKEFLKQFFYGNYSRAEEIGIQILKASKTKKDEQFVNLMLNRIESNSNLALADVINKVKKFGTFYIPNDLTNDKNWLDINIMNRYFLSSDNKTFMDSLMKKYKKTELLYSYGINSINTALLTGDSGVGKTLFLKKMSHELNLPLFIINTSSLIDSAMGQSSRNLNDLFFYLQDTECILFLDEIDGIIGSRTGLSAESAGREQHSIITHFLKALDSLTSKVLFVGATNIPDSLDSAALRRFNLIHDFKRLKDDEKKLFVDSFVSNLAIDIELTSDEYDILYNGSNLQSELSEEIKVFLENKL